MSDEPVGQVPASASKEPRDGLEALTEEVLPALITRLRASHLGELEVRTDGWRVRLRRDGGATLPRAASASPTAEASPTADSAVDSVGVVASVARSPAVGYFMPAPDLAMGHSVQVGDLLGSIDVLGIVQDVTALSGGIISRVLAEDGQAVEYGQPLADIDPLEVELEAAAADAGSGAEVGDR